MIEKYPIEAATDLRKFYGISVFDIPEKISWAEAVLLFSGLMKNTESQLRAAVLEIPSTYTYSDMIAIESINLFARANTDPKKKIDRIRGVWEKDNSTKKINTRALPEKEAEEFFRKLGHNPNRIK